MLLTALTCVNPGPEPLTPHFNIRTFYLRGPHTPSVFISTIPDFSSAWTTHALQGTAQLRETCLIPRVLWRDRPSLQSMSGRTRARTILTRIELAGLSLIVLGHVTDSHLPCGIRNALPPKTKCRAIASPPLPITPIGPPFPPSHLLINSYCGGPPVPWMILNRWCQYYNLRKIDSSSAS